MAILSPMKRNTVIGILFDGGEVVGYGNMTENVIVLLWLCFDACGAASADIDMAVILK
jgi:hypothetical protein